MTDDAERFFELRDEVDREAQMYTEAASGDQPSSLTDETGALTVSIDSDGLISFAIANNWQDHIGASELADRLLGTFQALSTARLESWGTRLGEAQEHEHRATALPSTSDSVAEKLRTALTESPDAASQVERMLENVLEMLEDMTAGFDETFATAMSRGGRVDTVAPLSGHLTVNLTAGGQLLGITLDSRWAARSAATQITRELNEALREAREATAEERSSAALVGTPLEKYQRLIDNPDDFVSYITGR